MKTYYSRHTEDLDIDDAMRRRLWDERRVAFHFPEGPDEVIGPRDNESLDPNDYPTNAAINVRALREMARDGGYVVAEHHGHDEYLVGRVDPGTEIEILRGRWGDHGRFPGRPAVLKSVRLQDVQVLGADQIVPVLERRPTRATLRRWPRAGDVIAELVDGAGAADGGVNHWERAYLAWSELADYAKSGHTITYDTLGKLIGAHPVAVGFALTPIQDYCLDNDLPPFTILVQNKHTGLPGAGFTAWPADELEEGRKEVFAFDWAAYGNPFSFAANGDRKEDIVERLVADPASAGDVYALAKVRGGVQMLFRDAVLRAYGERCAFSGSTVREGLEAAHIVPWRHASHAERVDVRNGLLLTSWHHRLFDAELLSLDEDYRIQVGPDLLSSGSTFDRAALAELDGKLIHLPQDPQHHPDPDLIRKRVETLESVH